MWKDIIGFEGYYQINEYGEVLSLRRNSMMKPSKTANGYLQVELSVNGTSKKFYVHRLVALNYLENPNNYKEINHIDHIKTNNHFSNLEWVTRKDNLEKMSRFYNNGFKTLCKNCNKEIHSSNADNKQYCSRECHVNFLNETNVSKRKVINRPTKEALLELIKNNSFVEIGKMFNVSDSAIRKWCKSYDLPFKKKDIDKLK